MKHKQLITFLKNKGFFLAKKEVRKTENGKRITDKKKSCYIISLSPFINDYTEIFRLFRMEGYKFQILFRISLKNTLV
jgi:hypothetical protein